MQDFNYTIHENDNIVSVALEGEMADVFASDKELKAEMMSFVEKGLCNCIIDLSQVKYMSSNGIGWLISLLTKFRNKGGDLILLNPSEHINKLLLITKLNGIFDVFDNSEEAISFFKK